MFMFILMILFIVYMSNGIRDFFLVTTCVLRHNVNSMSINASVDDW